MKGSNLSPVDARRVGLDGMFQIARDLAKRSGCKNDTNLPNAIPPIAKANWPGYEE
jgi:hypothetical protein